jgi:hypothetical protein
LSAALGELVTAYGSRGTLGGGGFAGTED